VSSRIELIAVGGIGEVAEGSSIAELISSNCRLRDGDVVCISQKIVSKSEGRVRELDAVEASAEAEELAARLEKDPAIVELVLGESRRLVRAERGVLITETHSGLICANAGIDASNVPGARAVALLPEDCDLSARRIRAELGELSGAQLAVLITDSFGRPWRVGQSEVAIGCAGLEPLDDWRGRSDSHGRELAATAIASVDQIAAAADLARDKTAGLPVVVVRGLGREIGPDGPGAVALQRPAEDDLFR
jgi:coenzyme F420-0:L-glutamate ligase / coenzyme F420-1:gamma-L-glutamate ligase